METSLSTNLRKYIFLYKKQDDASENEKDNIVCILEEMYYELKDEEIDFLELKGYM